MSVLFVDLREVLYNVAESSENDHEGKLAYD